jgi:hypothetical protein
MNALKQLVDFLQVYAKSPILNSPASPGDLSEVEDIVGHKLPEDVLAAYLLGNGETELAGIVDMAVAACSTIIVEIGIVQGVPEAFCFRARALIHWDRSR